MSEVRSLELLLDADTEAGVRDEWAALAAAGLSSMAAHTGATNRPHITLVARSGGLPAHLRAVHGRLPLPITLGAPLLFGDGPRRVLARSVVPSAALLALHEAVHSELGAADDLPHTEPGRWSAHVTLARRVRLEDLPVALGLLGGEVTGAAVGLRRWDAVTATVTTLV